MQGHCALLHVISLVDWPKHVKLFLQHAEQHVELHKAMCQSNYVCSTAAAYQTAYCGCVSSIHKYYFTHYDTLIMIIMMGHIVTGILKCVGVSQACNICWSAIICSEMAL